MSHESVALAQALFDGWAREGFPGRIDLLDPNIEYVNPPGAIEPGVRKGIEAFVAAMDSVLGAWTSWRMQPERFVAVANKVAVVIRYEAEARSSGITIEGRESALLTLRRGKIVRYEWFHGPDDALNAVGLDE
jgi:ketosteroid isomerase-like protein